MPEQTTLEIHAEASRTIAAEREQVWEAVADLSQRPNLKSFEPLSGKWPCEGSSVRTLIDKGEIKMSRTEKVIRSVPQERLILKVEAPEWGSVGWLDHRIELVDEGCRLTIGVIAIANFPEGAGPKSREEYAALSREGLQVAVREYQKRIVSRA